MLSIWRRVEIVANCDFYCIVCVAIFDLCKLNQQQKGGGNMSRKWNRDLIKEEITKRYRAKRKLNSNFVQQHCRPLYMAGCVYFGSWKASIEAAGLRYDDVCIKERPCPVWSQSKIIKLIRRKHSLKEQLNSNHIQTKEPKLYAATVKYFGGWSQAIAAAGIDYAVVRTKAPIRSWSKTKIVEEIVKRDQSELSIRGADVSQEDRGLYHAAMRYFGKNGWAKARMLAGFDPVDPLPWIIWTRETVCKEIRRLNDSNVDLSAGSMQKGSYANVLAGARKVFGSWEQAIEATGLKYSCIRKMRMRWWTRSRVLLRICSLEQQGVRLSSKDMQKRYGDLFGAAIKHFGCWSLAVEAAGIPYRMHCRTWSTKAWLRKMTSADYETTIQTATIHAKKRRMHEKNHTV